MSEVARQTISYLQRRLASVGLEPKGRLGQNFLIDLNLLDLLVRSADIHSTDVVLEIGTGMGSLTAKLAARAAAVVTVEVDRFLQQLAREELESFDTIRFLQLDALHNKNRIADEVLDAVQSELRVDPNRRFKVAANLPFCIATPVLSNLLTTPIVPVSFTVTIQKDLAERIVARPSTKDYSALSIWIQSLCDVDVIRILPPTVFWPRPKVESAIIQIRPSTEKRSRIGNLSFFHQLVRSLFCHRRKLLRTSLAGAVREHLDKPSVDLLLGQMKLPVDARAEQLGIEQFIELAESIFARIGGGQHAPTLMT